MDSEISFGHYHQKPGASCSILYVLVLPLVLFIQSLYPLSNLRNLSFTSLLSLTLAEHVQQRVIVVSRFVALFVCLSVPTFSLEPWLL